LGIGDWDLVCHGGTSCGVLAWLGGVFAVGEPDVVGWEGEMDGGLR